MVKQQHRGLTIHTIMTYLMWDTPVVCRPHEHRQCPNHCHRLYPTLHQGTPPPCPLWTWSPAPGESHPPQSSLELSVRVEYNITTCKECIHVTQHMNLSNYANRCEGSYHYCTEKYKHAFNQAKMLPVSHPLPTGYISENTRHMSYEEWNTLTSHTSIS